MNEELCRALTNALGKDIRQAEYASRQLHGGTVGDVQLLKGLAETAGGETLPFQLVLKTQKKWERYADPLSWRREYDLYISGFDAVLTDGLRWPKCFYAEDRGNETRLWMEYMDGVSGNDLTPEMLEHAAEELGRFQGKWCAGHPELRNVSNLNGTDFMQNEYRQWGPHAREYAYIRASDCPIPEHLCQMLIDMDAKAPVLFDNFHTLPVVLCHKDFWLENIFDVSENCILIDWDTAGWGYLGEDIASLIADDTDIERLDEYYRRLIPAYYRGVSETMDVSAIKDDFIFEMILIKFGYRFIYRYMHSSSQDLKDCQVRALEHLYEIMNRKRSGRIDALADSISSV